MGLHLGGDITGMWWDGDVTAVYAGADLVWQAIITVTPPAPVFLDESPWIELPTVEGVTYHVQGTPGAGATITVTAVAEDGYQLEGTTEWTHEWPLPRYTASGSRTSRQRISGNTWTTMDSHTVTHDGIASGDWTTRWGNTYSYSVHEVQILLNGTQIAHHQEEGGSTTRRCTFSDRQLSSGDTLAFRVWTDSITLPGRDVESWSWDLS